jgi:hypothetical protein
MVSGTICSTAGAAGVSNLVVSIGFERSLMVLCLGSKNIILFNSTFMFYVPYTEIICIRKFSIVFFHLCCLSSTSFQYCTYFLTFCCKHIELLDFKCAIIPHKLFRSGGDGGGPMYVCVTFV